MSTKQTIVASDSFGGRWWLFLLRASGSEKCAAMLWTGKIFHTISRVLTIVKKQYSG